MSAFPAENVYGHTKKLRFLLERIGELRRGRATPLRLLDFGCGSGEAVSQYLIGDGIDYLGVDDYAPSLAYANARFGGPHATFAPKIPAGANFNVIVYADVLEHLADPVGVLRDHAALLTVDGEILGSVPNGYGPYENEMRLDRQFGLRPRFDAALGAARAKKRELLGLSPPPAEPAIPYNHGSTHVQFFTRRSLERTLEASGLRMTRFAHGCFLGASISAYFLRGARVLEANTRIADRLPHWAVSTWYFCATRP